jgi:urease accessory protein
MCTCSKCEGGSDGDGVSTVRILFLAALLLFLPREAAAHAAFEEAGGFYGGLLHPLLVPTHMLALTATGALIAKQTRPERLVAIALFAAALLAGISALVFAVAPEHMAEVLLGIAVTAGALLALGRSVPRTLTAVLAIGLGLAIALDSPPQVVSPREATVILIGTFCGAVMLFGGIAECAALLGRPWQAIGMRVFGSWIAASAALALTFDLAR